MSPTGYTNVTHRKLSTAYNFIYRGQHTLYPVDIYCGLIYCGTCPVDNHVVFVSPTGYTNVTHRILSTAYNFIYRGQHTLYPVDIYCGFICFGFILWRAILCFCFPQDMSMSPQNITHRIYIPRDIRCTVHGIY